MEPSYPEPIGEALSCSSQRAAQLTSLFIALTQVSSRIRPRVAVRATKLIRHE